MSCGPDHNIFDIKLQFDHIGLLESNLKRHFCLRPDPVVAGREVSPGVNCLAHPPAALRIPGFRQFAIADLI